MTVLALEGVPFVSDGRVDRPYSSGSTMNGRSLCMRHLSFWYHTFGVSILLPRHSSMPVLPTCKTSSIMERPLKDHEIPRFLVIIKGGGCT